MSFEVGFLLVCLSFLGLIIIGLTLSTVLMGSRVWLRFQYMFRSLKFDKEVDGIIDMILAKVQEEMLIPKLCDKSIKFYSPESWEAMKTRDRWDSRDTEDAEIFIGQKFTQYGYLTKYHDLSRYELQNKGASYKTFRAILALEDDLRGVGKKVTPKPEKEKKYNNKQVELE